MIWAAAAFAVATCLEPSGPKITVGDLASVVPALRAVDPATPLGYAPRPGVVRRFHMAELARLLPDGAASGLPESVCVEWAMKRPDSDSFRESMLEVLPEGARLAILETSLFPVPSGPLRFPLTGLHSPVWRGYVEYAPGARYEVWARVDVQVPAERVLASRDIAAGTTIETGMVHTESVMSRPGATDLAASVDEVVGRAARRTLRQGAPVPLSALERRVDVRKGDIVRVRVQAGAASIGAQGVALASAATGEIIGVRVNETGRTVRARIAGPGEAMLQLPGGN